MAHSATSASLQHLNPGIDTLNKVEAFQTNQTLHYAGKNTYQKQQNLNQIKFDTNFEINSGTAGVRNRFVLRLFCSIVKLLYSIRYCSDFYYTILVLSATNF